MKKFEERAQRAVSLAKAVPRHRKVPRKLVHESHRSRVDSVALRCINVRNRQEPRAIRVRDLCPACDLAYLAEVGWKEGLRCPECGWLCKSEQAVGSADSGGK